MWNWVHQLAEWAREDTPFAVVTVTECKGSTPAPPGAKLLVRADGTFHGTIGGGHLEQLVLQDARACLARGEARTFRYPLGAKLGQCCGGVVDVFVEPVNHGPQLYLFGAGHVGQALCRVLEGTPFRVHLVDERAEWVQSPQVPAGVVRHEEAWDEFASRAVWDEQRTYVAVMTHRHDVDQDIIAFAIQKPARYIGLIGSDTKWARFRQRLEAKGMPARQVGRVQCPMGLPTGGKSPQEVAVSIAAGLLQLHHGLASGLAQEAGAQPAPVPLLSSGE
ncbi:xanthine dehydrogenase accessory protein XdhC [Corallococcus sp. AB004]|uniref:xanthine dehydrogenase accessory protein XdhC n=1 Tax=Corallococcus exiguus TaxID=83462 RepID=UPI000EA0621A|nr:xanthine dehydrogenase accessory protein XdhC [Corallococcus exiguus]NPC70025.1 xanthine dehydrogenase accessory protein XdhC [Corallococcus exiguus]NPD28663.1 xanthine dehydrogenase accessory protein XdhC [Corallococcus exiguus]RKI36809.1 xanthine dehydrogenase accessory protein XdhC [Corallococcus sp. AB004]